jgi:hypothetical protein
MREEAAKEDSDYVEPDSHDEEAYSGTILQTDSND